MEWCQYLLLVSYFAHNTPSFRPLSFMCLASDAHQNEFADTPKSIWVEETKSVEAQSEVGMYNMQVSFVGQSLRACRHEIKSPPSLACHRLVSRDVAKQSPNCLS